jgi:thioesterase domain-containing protein
MSVSGTPQQRLQRIEDYFHQKIPLTRAMGVKVESWDGMELKLTAPLTLNHNHLGTAFGGSLSTLATLAGYGMLWLLLDDPDTHVVIRDSAIRFRKPVKGDLHAVCRRPEETTWASFINEFRQKGKARLRLAVTIEEDGAEAVAFEGTFVAMR